MANYKGDRRWRGFVGGVVSAVLLLGAFPFSEPAQAFDLQLHGFADLVASKSSTEYSLNSISNHGSRLSLDPESDLGLNLSSDLGGNLMFFAQLVGSGAESGQYKMGVDWVFISYHPVEALNFRVGRQITPVFMLSEQINVGLTYLWTRIPYEVYGLYPLKAFNGLSAIYTLDLGSLRLRTDVFAGAGDFTVNGFSGSSDGLLGIDFSLSSDHFKLRTGYAQSTPLGTITASVPLTVTPMGTISGTFAQAADLGTIQMVSLAGSFESGGWVGTAELARIWGTGSLIRAATGAYTSLGFRVLPRLTPYVAYSWQGALSGSAYVFPDVATSATLRTDQHSEILGLNFRATPSAGLKMEYMRTQENFVDSSRNFGADTFSASICVVF